VFDFPFNMTRRYPDFVPHQIMRLNAVIAILAMALALIAIGLFAARICKP
jgi:hypothetical protein